MADIFLQRLRQDNPHMSMQELHEYFRQQNAANLYDDFLNAYRSQLQALAWNNFPSNLRGGSSQVLMQDAMENLNSSGTWCTRNGGPAMILPS